MTTDPGRTLIMGLGNRVMADDAAGIFALERFEKAFLESEAVAFLEGGTLGLELLVHMEGYDNVLIFDCLMGVGEHGEVVAIGKEEAHAAFERALSPHQMGLRDILALLEFMGRMPKNLAVVGIVGREIDVGLELTPSVANALDGAVAKAAEILRTWGVEVARRPC